MFTARVKDTTVFSTGILEESLARAVSNSLQETVWGLEREINKTIKDTFYVPADPARYSSVMFRKRKGKVYSAELSYNYKAIPLSRYPVKQYRITTGKRILSVKRGAGQTKGNKFKQQIVGRAAIRTDVKIRKTGPWKTVEGKLGFKGWLHTGRSSSKLAAHIYERNQRETWAGGQRQPFHRLFGPSIAQLVRSKEVQATIEKSFKTRTIEKIIGDSIRW
jgi:hypothetical protein